MAQSLCERECYTTNIQKTQTLRDTYQLQSEVLIADSSVNRRQKVDR